MTDDDIYMEMYSAAMELAKGASMIEEEAIIVMVSEKHCTSPPDMVAYFRRWNVPLSEIYRIAADIEPAMARRGFGDLSAFKAELAKAMLADAETTEPAQWPMTRS